MSRILAGDVYDPSIWPEISSADGLNAHFEAGHAVIAWLEDLKIVRVSIEPNGDTLSWIDILGPIWHLSLSLPYDLRKVKSIIRSLLAGQAAQLRFSLGSCPTDFDITDRHLLGDETMWRAISLAGAIPFRGTPLLPVLWDEVTTMIQAPGIWAAVEAVAAALLRDGELAGIEIEEIAQHAINTFNAPGVPW